MHSLIMQYLKTQLAARFLTRIKKIVPYLKTKALKLVGKKAAEVVKAVDTTVPPAK